MACLPLRQPIPSFPYQYHYVFPDIVILPMDAYSYELAVMELFGADVTAPKQN